MTSNVKVFSGNSNPLLAQRIAKKMGIRVERAEISTFSDGEIRVELQDCVRGSTAYIIQSTCAPVNNNLMELALLTDALKRSAINKVVAVVPYFGYSRQDRRPGYSRVPISARVAADLLQGAGVDHLITMDLHASQIQGFFKIPVDDISATQIFVADIYRNWMDSSPIIVSPDVGGVARARSIAKHLNNMDLAIVDKRRPKAGVAEVMNIIGDVEGRTCIIIDDIVDSAGTLGKAADALINIGKAKRVVAYATHGILSGKAYDNITNSKIEKIIVTDTLPLSVELQKHPKIRQLSIANLFAETINRIDHNLSISELLD